MRAIGAERDGADVVDGAAAGATVGARGTSTSIGDTSAPCDGDGSLLPDGVRGVEAAHADDTDEDDVEAGEPTDMFEEADNEEASVGAAKADDAVPEYMVAPLADGCDIRKRS